MNDKLTHISKVCTLFLIKQKIIFTNILNLGGKLFMLEYIRVKYNMTYKAEQFNKFNSIYHQNNIVREEMPDVLEILLIDRTTTTSRKTKNIIWAHNNYITYGNKDYAASEQIKPELITDLMSDLIKPRALKTLELQKHRTKSKAEVFTPVWIVKEQIDKVEEEYIDSDLEKYIKFTWLEITCGEAPYMTTRYEMDTGEIIPLDKRVGFIDRKLSRINNEVDDKAEWQRLAEEAYKASYGFEWSGDSLLLARENLLYTFIDNYDEKWSEIPSIGIIKNIAKIISYNVFQMDGLKYIIPLSEKREKVKEVQLSLFDDEPNEKWIIKPGKRVKIMNWETNKLEFFDKGAK